MEDDDVLLSPTTAETRAWVQAAMAKWPPAAAPAEEPRDLSKLYLLAWPFIVTYWFWFPWLATKISDLLFRLASLFYTGSF